MDPGMTEVVYSHTEKIGMPNWSWVTVLASAKTQVPVGEYDNAFNFFHAVVNEVIKEQSEKIARALSMWAGASAQLDPGTKQGMVPQGISIQSSELTYSMTETVGLPEKSSINLLASSKQQAPAGLELIVFDELAAKVSKQMFVKRDLVLANPRPWTQMNS